MAELSFTDILSFKWLPPKSKIIEIYAENVSSVTINPRIGYRHKLLSVRANQTSSVWNSMQREALDVVLGPKTLMRIPVWLWGDNNVATGQVGTFDAATALSNFLMGWIQRGIVDLLPDAAADEAMTLNFISGTSYPVVSIRYVEYPSDDAMNHNVPGGSDYYKKYFSAWFYLFSTTVGNGQELTETGEPFGMSLLGENGTIPPNKLFHQYGLLSGYENANQSSSITNYTVYNALHEWKNDEELWTPDTHAGLYCNQQQSGILTETTQVFWGEEKRIVDFNPNDRLSLYADVTSVTGSGSPLWVVIDGVLEDLSKKPAGAGAPA